MSTARILVAEDSPTQAEALKLILEMELGGPPVEVVSNGLEALERLQREAFDLVIADATMPGMDGLALSRAVRGDASMEHVGIVMLSGREDPDAKRAALSVGVEAWLTKPLEIDELVAIIRRRESRQ